MTDPKIKQADTFLESIIWSAEHARKILWSCEDDDGPTLQEIEKISDHLTDIEVILCSRRILLMKSSESSNQVPNQGAD